MFSFYLSHEVILENIDYWVLYKNISQTLFVYFNQTSFNVWAKYIIFDIVFKLLAMSTYGKFAQAPSNFTFATLGICQRAFNTVVSSNWVLRSSNINQTVAIVE